jgi:signal transduction histidine kinase
MTAPASITPASITPASDDRITSTRKVVAVLLPLGALALQRAVWPTLHHFTCLLFYPAVFLSSWIGGLYGGMASTALSVLLLWFYFPPPEGNLAPGNLLSLGVFICMGVLFSAVHERLRAARRREAATNAQIHRLRDEWAAIVAHDLQQPINNIVLRAELLLRGGSEERRREDVEQIRASIKRLSRMVNDLSEASLLETSRLRLVPERLDLRTLAADIVDRVPGAASRTTILAPHDEVFVRADGGRLEQVLANLLSNALKYGAAAPPVELAIEELNGSARVSVTNQGSAIPADEIPHLFERYARTRGARAGTAKGSGLGLYIAKGLVEAHGGRIWVESSTDKTAFRFTLPLDVSAAASAGRYQLTERAEISAAH